VNFGDPRSLASKPRSSGLTPPYRKTAFALLLAFALLTPVISAAYAVFALLVVAWVASLVRERRVPASLRSPFVLLAAALGLLTAASAVFSRDPAVSLRHLGGLSLLLLVPIAMDLIDDLKAARAVIVALAVSGTALALMGVWQYLHGGDDLENRIRGTLSHYMTFAGLATVAGGLLLGLALEARGRWRAAGLVCVVPLVAVLLTFTRGAYVGILAALLLYAAVRRPKAFLVLAPALVAVFLLAPADIRERIRSIGDLSDRTNRDRIAMARAGLRIVKDYPVLGLGPEMVKPYYPLYRDPDAPRWTVPHLHNNFLQTAAASGLFAVAVYAAWIALFLARAVFLLRREARPERRAIWAGALLAGTALCVAGLFEYNFGDTEVEMATLLVFALPFSRAASRPGD
jgi:O-antigen ligase